MEKRKCPAARVYEFIDIGTRKKRKAVRCLFKGNIYDIETITMYCLGNYELCPVYRSHVEDKGSERESQSEK